MQVRDHCRSACHPDKADSPRRVFAEIDVRGHAFDLYDTSAQRDARIFDFRGGTVLGKGEIPGGLAWATLSEIGELG